MARSSNELSAGDKLGRCTKPCEGALGVGLCRTIGLLACTGKLPAQRGV